MALMREEITAQHLMSISLPWWMEKEKHCSKKLKQVWDKSSELEIECETILSPTVIPCDEFEKYRESLPYYKNIEQEGIELYCCKMKLGEN